ncbi:hypothetical protein BC629DRAFT_1207875 [Irpex lacteus]|nr:hypothetical protein BC629DRAFT_1207875 [Irpex lacteus]
MPAPKPYSGYIRKLVLAFDVGTTFSGVSYAVLDHGEIPKIQAITRYPGQENGDSKIPTVLYYDKDGNVRAAGAEARSSAMELIAEDEDLTFVEWFKLHLRPETMKKEASPESELGALPLPDGKNVVEVLADFLHYLYDCARQFIIETHPNGESLWNSVEDHIEVILSHPNGWEGLQQSKMRDAAILACLVPDTTLGRQHVHFVTEGEASLHYCMNCGLATDAVRDGKSVMIIDAGGGTVDLSTYHFKTSAPVTVEETTAAACIIQGSTRVNVHARLFLETKLEGSIYDNMLTMNDMLEHFERSVKPTFKDSSERCYIKFGGRRDTNQRLGIRNGQLILEGHEVASFFEASVEGIVDAAREQYSKSSTTISLALLVGGYAASPWLYSKLKEKLADMDLHVSRPDSHTHKAVAEGAVSFYLSNIVTSRVSQLTYGSPCYRTYRPHHPEHVARSHKLVTRPSGELTVPGGFSTILTKGTRTFEGQELSICLTRTSPSPITRVRCEVVCYRGPQKNPRWIDEGTAHFSTLCAVHAVTPLAENTKKLGTEGYFYEQDFKVVILCGSTEMKAQVSWEENGVEKRSPASIVYDDDPNTSRLD